MQTKTAQCPLLCTGHFLAGNSKILTVSTLIQSLSKVGSFINVVNIYCGLVDTSSEASMARYVISYVRIFQSNFCLLCAILIGENNTVEVEETKSDKNLTCLGAAHCVSHFNMSLYLQLSCCINVHMIYISLFVITSLIKV